VTTPAVPEPDTKDWTWSISRPCPDCGFDARQVRHEDVPALTIRYAATVRERATRDNACARPKPATWSPLEYGCHVRDVLELFHHRLGRMLAEDDPLFDNWDQDVTAVEKRYWEQDPVELARDLDADAARMAAAFTAVHGAQWQRPGRRSNGSVFTVDTFARYFLHDLAHHAHDVTGRSQPVAAETEE
jgi:hypothetical protein